MRLVMGAALLMAQQATAQDWATRDGDAYLTPGQMLEQVVGRDLTFYDDGVSLYSADGTYSYTYDGGDTAFGTYEIGENGVVCTVFQNGFDRCDLIVRNGVQLVVITQKGDRYPVRP